MINKLKNELENININTTSNDILNKYNNKSSKLFNYKLIIYPTLLAMCLIISLVLYLNLNNTNTSFNKVEKTSGVTNGLKDNTLLGNLSLELFYACNITSVNDTTKLISEEDNELKEVVDDINNKYDIIGKMYNNKEGLSFSYNEDKYVYEDITYNYCFNVEGYKLYVIDELIEEEYYSKALYLIDDSIYLGNVEIECEEDEFEIKLSYSTDEFNIVIEREMEEFEFCYKYKAYNLSNLLLYEYSISIEEEEELEIEYKLKNSINNDNTVIEFKGNKNKLNIIYKKNTKNISYNYKNIILTVSDNKLIYTYNNKSIEKLKNYQ